MNPQKRKRSYQLREPSFTNVINFIQHHRTKSVAVPQAEDIILSDDDADVQDGSCKRNIDSSNSQSNGSSLHSSDKSSSFSIEQCVAILEPHLEAFRLLNQLEREEENTILKNEYSNLNNKVNNNIKSSYEIPPQLLRLARFFKWRWAPIRRAILRPASVKEIEIGSRLRLQLAMSLQLKGFIAIAEIDELTLSFRQVCDTDGFFSKECSLSDRIEASFSKLPIEASLTITSSTKSTLNAAIRHVTPVLKLYCDVVRSQSKSKPINVLNSFDEVELIENTSKERLSPTDVAELALIAFTGIVAAKGLEPSFDCKSSIDDVFEESEKVLVKALCDRSKDAGVEIVTEEVHKQLSTCLSSSMLDSLSGLQILAISRMLYHMNDAIIDEYLSNSIISCLISGGTSGISTLPKIISLIAMHTSLRNHKNQPGDKSKAICTIDQTYLANLRMRLEGEVKTLLTNQKGLASKIIKISDFISILFQTSNYLLKHH